MIYAMAVWLLFPDNPLQAKFLTLEERAQAVLRIKENHSGIEQKRFKRYQFLEAIKDQKTWLFFLHSWSQEMANGITNQYSLIIESFGFTTAQTTLLGMVTGATALISLGTAAVLLWKLKVGRPLSKYKSILIAYQGLSSLDLYCCLCPRCHNFNLRAMYDHCEADFSLSIDIYSSSTLV